ncbi:MAG: HAD hydrolase family protein [Candidatus Omnitrophica bacterium]|nr:HAD hydrolase family protein [Candidatus Omnitrophota bacterium]
MTRDFVDRARKIRLLALDVDGVLTDGRIILDDRNGHAKHFDVHDGFGLVLWAKAGRASAIITAERSQIVARRARQLRIRWVAQYARDKRKAYERLRRRCGLPDAAICFLGDDLLDLPVLTRVGLAIATANAVPEVKREAHYVTRRPGGRGAVREAIGQILKAQGRWAPLVQEFLRR